MSTRKAFTPQELRELADEPLDAFHPHLLDAMRGALRFCADVIDAADLPKQPAALEVVAWRIRYRSEPGMIGHYPWTYIERIRGTRQFQHEYEPLVRLSEAEEALQQAALRYVSLFGELQRSIEANEVLRADAERYRWLRDVGDATWRPFGIREGYSAKQADAAIDSALALAAKEAKQ